MLLKELLEKWRKQAKNALVFGMIREAEKVFKPYDRQMLAYESTVKECLDLIVNPDAADIPAEQKLTSIKEVLSLCLSGRIPEIADHESYPVLTEIGSQGIDLSDDVVIS